MWLVLNWVSRIFTFQVRHQVAQENVVVLGVPLDLGDDKVTARLEASDVFLVEICVHHALQKKMSKNTVANAMTTITFQQIWNSVVSSVMRSSP
jgi:hypothetical protein